MLSFLLDTTLGLLTSIGDVDRMHKLVSVRNTVYKSYTHSSSHIMRLTQKAKSDDQPHPTPHTFSN